MCVCVTERQTHSSSIFSRHHQTKSLDYCNGDNRVHGNDGSNELEDNHPLMTLQQNLKKNLFNLPFATFDPVAVPSSGRA